MPFLLCIRMHLTLIPMLLQSYLPYNFNMLLIMLYGWNVLSMIDFASLQDSF